MPTIQITLPKPHENQRAIIRNDKRFLVVACGRRFGKTEAGKQRIVDEALRGKTCWWIAPTYDTAMSVWRELKAVFRPLPNTQISESLREIQLVTGGSIAVKSGGTDNNLRGAGLDFVVLDEFAFMPREIWTTIVRPMLMLSKGKALFLSTPYGRNHFWDLFTYAQSGDSDEWQAITFTTYDNPLIDAKEIDASRRDMTEREFREEIMAEFVDASGSVFRRVKEAVYHETPELTQDTYVIGVDLAKTQDYTVFTVLNTRTKRVHEVDRFNSVEYITQAQRLNALRMKYHNALCIIETNNTGTAFIEIANRLGINVNRFTTTQATKQNIINQLAVAFEHGEIEIPNHKELINELLAFEAEALPSGSIRYSAPDNKHDDTVMSLAIAWSGVRKVPDKFEVIYA